MVSYYIFYPTKIHVILPLRESAELRLIDQQALEPNLELSRF